MMSKRFLMAWLLLSFCGYCLAQIDTTRHVIYDRPFVFNVGRTASVGGYFEANANYFVEEGISEGLSFEARRFNLFLYSAISPAVRLFSELEFEHGTEEIVLETAVLDLAFDPFLNFRMGVLLPPLGQFNIEHDSPKYTVIDRPLVSTQIIPATLSEIGMGLYGQRYLDPQNRIGYEFYVVNGLSDGIINNEEGATRIARGKSEELLEEDNNGIPSVAGRIRFENRRFGKYGLSYYGGIYNTFEKEALSVDEKRGLRILAIDYEHSFGNIHVRGEYAYATIDVPGSLADLFAEKQWGFYSELEYAYYRGKLLNLENSRFIACLRVEKIDLNVGRFSSTNTNIGDETVRISIANSFRLDEDTVFKLVYQYNWLRDLFDNPINEAGLQVGIATYF